MSREKRDTTAAALAVLDTFLGYSAQINRDNNDLKDHLVRTTMAKLSIDQPYYSGYLKAIKDGYSKD